MPRITITKEVPLNGCEKCDCSSSETDGLYCVVFGGVNWTRLRKNKNYKYQRCKACLKAEVKEDKPCQE
ncbi:MAG: hypothetical protein PHO27_12125 [Sulfuricurvum sp.]|jgi:hypothetical protein|nr:hypothetical protein [Sulfuricurvum sp.]